jgi:hypothetical protein
MRRFLRPSFRRPLPDFLVPKAFSVFEFDPFVPTAQPRWRAIHFIVAGRAGARGL